MPRSWRESPHARLTSTRSCGDVRGAGQAGSSVRVTLIAVASDVAVITSGEPACDQGAGDAPAVRPTATSRACTRSPAVAAHRLHEAHQTTGHCHRRLREGAGLWPTRWQVRILAPRHRAALPRLC